IQPTTSCRQGARQSYRPARVQADAREGRSTMQPRPRRTDFGSSRLASWHPTRDESRHAFACAYDPDRSYHSHLPSSPDDCIQTPMAAPSVISNLKSFAGASGFEQNIAQLRCVASLKTESIAEYPSFVPASRMQRIQAIVLDLANIEDCLVAVRQARH